VKANKSLHASPLLAIHGTAAFGPSMDIKNSRLRRLWTGTTSTKGSWTRQRTPFLCDLLFVQEITSLFCSRSYDDKPPRGTRRKIR